MHTFCLVFFSREMPCTNIRKQMFLLQGFRNVLPKEQRGASVSLISCGAEVIQINKKFFQKFADETVCSLINMKVNRVE